MLPLFLVIFALVIPPALYGYNRTNSEVYYDMGQCLPEDMAYVIANEKLSEDFGVASTHMLLVDSGVPAKEVRAMIRKMEAVDGVRCVLGKIAASMTAMSRKGRVKLFSTSAMMRKMAMMDTVLTTWKSGGKRNPRPTSFLHNRRKQNHQLPRQGFPFYVLLHSHARFKISG